MSEPSESRLRQTILRATADGRVVPFLGAGVNMVRPAHGRGLAARPRTCRAAGAGRLPGRPFGYPAGRAARPAARLAVRRGHDGLGPALRGAARAVRRRLSADPRARASWPAAARRPAAGRGARRYQLIVTTNYDDVLERAFGAAGEPFDLVAYVAEGRAPGQVPAPCRPTATPRLIERPNEYDGLSLDQRTVILKIHGAVDRVEPERDSYVITEDHYIDYLTRTDSRNLVPVDAGRQAAPEPLPVPRLQPARLEPARHPAPHLGRAGAAATSPGPIQLDPKPLDEEFWRRRDVEILDVPLDELRRRPRRPRSARCIGGSAWHATQQPARRAASDGAAGAGGAVPRPDALRRGGRAVLLRPRRASARSSSPT